MDRERVRSSNRRAEDDSSPEYTYDSDSDVDSGREYNVDAVRVGLKSSRGSRFNLIEHELRLDRRDRETTSSSAIRRKFSRETLVSGIRFVSFDYFIRPDNKWYRAWTKFILIWAVYSSCFTPLEFGFFRGLPENLFILDIVGQVAFLIDIVLQFFVAYRDSQTYRMVFKRDRIAYRYLKSHFTLDFLGCLPWDIIYKACGRREEVRYLLWIRLSRVRKLIEFFQTIEKDIRINYLFTRIVKLIVVEVYCTHTAACIFYYLATTIPPSQEGYTWIGSLQMGDYKYSHFREIDIWKRYTTSLYFAIVTMATVGYGDIHAVNMREMIFVMVFVSFDMILGAYLIGNMTALIVKGSKTERFRDKMTDLIKYMNRNRLGKEIRNQVKGHVRLQYESSYTEASVIQDIPVSIRAKISQTLYLPSIENVPLFKDCSLEFMNQILRCAGEWLVILDDTIKVVSTFGTDSTFFMVTKLHEEFFLPGEVIMEQGNVVDQLYFICHGLLEEVGIGENGLEETVSVLQPNNTFGEISVLCNIAQPYTVRVCELCRLLRLEKQSFLNILEIYFYDGRKILNNILEGKDYNFRDKQLESDITYHIGKQEAELALRVNSAAHHGDHYQLKRLIRAGADPKKTDYDGRSPLHLASSRGYEHITFFLIKEGVDINVKDKFGNTPLLEAVKNGHEAVASLLVKEGASLNIEDAGSFLCQAVVKGDLDFLRRVLVCGIDPNSKDYNHRTPLHVAASEGLHSMAKLLIEAGASVFSKDRLGNTPLDDGRTSGNKIMMKLLEDAKATQLSEQTSSSSSHRVLDYKTRPRKCTVYPFHPWGAEEHRRPGMVLWIPGTMEELVETAVEKLQLSETDSYCILSEEAGKLIDIDMIDDGQKLYLISEHTLDSVQ